MKIGELAKATGTQVETIRYYERAGLLPEPLRTDGNYRVYEKSHVQRLAFIRHCRCLDMTLEEIGLLLQFKDDPQSDCGDVDRILDEHIEHVVVRIRELKALEKQLRSLRSECTPNSDPASCGVIGGLERDAQRHDHAAKVSHRHIAGAHGAGPGRKKASARKKR
ncbi:Cd(II)/Pb(II)-responsive transcriptional regulator [Caenimonas sedimenti]|uniref:Cd(II)/Pb(II)-responsive transcriptional regulator n=1 Tax=Caenimonas sedimenti TaxID=2596921 RepID=A0A562ZHW8_9BURK|nr:Cd(II)/Pb(II)-responsive transcriptional regulator [Caenimonas sedimenti]TWO68001.1 Cd(II)/Pb(II)-responsive transcriptional regulator [Caenimonas sedimenti]